MQIALTPRRGMVMHLAIGVRNRKKIRNRIKIRNRNSYNKTDNQTIGNNYNEKIFVIAK